MDAFLQNAYQFVAAWYPAILPVISTSLGLIGFYFNLRRLREAKTDLQKRQQDAIEELRNLIRTPLLAPRLASGLITANFIRSNALAVAAKRACGEITVPMMGEAIRWVSLDLQQYFTGQQLKNRLDILNNALKELDSTIPPLLSLANSDPVAGFYLGQVVLVAASSVITVICAILFIVTNKVGYLIASLIPLSIHVYFYIASGRAVRFLRVLGGQGISSGPNGTLREKVSIKKTIDFFLFAFLSPSRSAYLFWNSLFGPLWETPLTVLLTPAGFLGMHGCRFLVARVVHNELHRLQNQVIRKSFSGVAPSTDELKQLEQLFDHLWVLTADKSLLVTKEQWKNGPPLS